MEDLTKIEETVLIAIWQLEDDAYGYRIRQHILDTFLKEFTIGHLYSVLNQLDKKGHVCKSIGEESERRRGKPKVFYTVTEAGMQALESARKAYSRIWKGIPVEAFDGKQE